MESIASLLIQFHFVLRLANSEYGGQPPMETWEQTWDKQAVTEEERREQKAMIASEVQLLMENSAIAADRKDEEHATSALTALPTWHSTSERSGN